MHSQDWIETERTRMRPFEPTDLDTCYAWFSDPDVMQFIPGGIDRTVEDTRQRIAGYCRHQLKHGFSKRIVFHRDSGEAVGDAGLYHLPDGERIELGFRFKKPYWGQGYAVEVGRAWLEWFDQNLPGQALYADVFPTHSRSQRVLSKLGFGLSHTETVYGVMMYIYERSQSEAQ